LLLRIFISQFMPSSFIHICISRFEILKISYLRKYNFVVWDEDFPSVCMILVLLLFNSNANGFLINVCMLGDERTIKQWQFPEASDSSSWQNRTEWMRIVLLLLCVLCLRKFSGWGIFYSWAGLSFEILKLYWASKKLLAFILKIKNYLSFWGFP
jgi:hypothetical protein